MNSDNFFGLISAAEAKKKADDINEKENKKIWFELINKEIHNAINNGYYATTVNLINENKKPSHKIENELIEELKKLGYDAVISMTAVSYNNIIISWEKGE